MNKRFLGLNIYSLVGITVLGFGALLLSKGGYLDGYADGISHCETYLFENNLHLTKND